MSRGQGVFQGLPLSLNGVRRIMAEFRALTEGSLRIPDAQGGRSPLEMLCVVHALAPDRTTQVLPWACTAARRGAA